MSFFPHKPPFLSAIFVLKIAIFLLLVGAEQALFAQIDSLPPQIITDSLSERFRNHSQTIYFQKDSLGSFGVVGVSADAILRQVQGVSIRHYGGRGGIKTVSFRGFSSHQTTLSIADIPYQQPQSSMINFGNLFLESFDALEVEVSPTSGIQNPLGANVNVEIHPSQSQIRIWAGAGAFGLLQGGLVSDYHLGKMKCRMGVQMMKAEDNYPYVLHQERGTRQNAAVLSNQFQGYYQYPFSPSLSVSYFLTGYRNKQGIPGPILTGNVHSSSDSLYENDIFQFFKIKYTALGAAPKWIPSQAEASLSHHFNRMQVIQSSFLQNYLSHDVNLQAKFRYFFSRQSITGVFQYSPSRLSGNNLAIDFQPIEEVKRKQWNFSLGHVSYLGAQIAGKSRFQTQVLVRLNQVRQYGTLFNMSGELLYRPPIKKINGEIFVHGNMGNRVPSFNELYYFGFGNSALNPEEIRSYDIGMLLQTEGKIPYSLKWNFFHNRTMNKIIAIPISPARWSTQSIGQAQTLGVEYAFELRIPKAHSLYLNYTLQKAIDATRPEKPLLPYTPREISSYGYKFERSNVQIFLQGNYSGWRFAGRRNKESEFLPAYHTLDMGIVYRKGLRKLRYAIFLTGENILNASYVVIQSYPMLPRTLSFKTEIVWK